MANYKLYYFPLRGRAEISRLLFAAAGKKYEDIRITDEEWQEKRKTFPNELLPVLEINGRKVCESLAIARYLAREFGYAGKTNMDQLLIDQVVDTLNDYLGKFFDSYYTSEEKKEGELKKYLEEITPKTLQLVEKWLNENDQGNGFFVGKSCTMADLFIYEILTNVVQMDTKVLDPFPKLQGHRNRIASLAEIKEYLVKRPVSDV